MEKLFAYGTLLEPEVQKRVFTMTLKGIAAQLKGYEKFSVHIDSVQYPSIRIAPNGVVDGMVFEVSANGLQHTDAYEGSEYKRKKVLLESREHAWAYLT
jgi:gamma-glutamylcyclotransferase (GGCT)/AIG2-like uncharacterized protein YtfP